MKVSKKKWIRFRILLVALFFLFGLGIILARAYQLQVLEKEKLASLALEGYRGIIRLPPKRGTIFDREGHALAVSVEAGSVYAHPKLIKEKARVARQLSRILGVEKSALLSLLGSQRSFVWIDRKTSPEKIREVRALGLEGIGFTKESRRFYPGREIAGHLIGFSGSDNQGLEGLERNYDEFLRGPQYTLMQMRDALGRPFYISRPSHQGREMHNLTLTIDKDIQYKAEQTLRSAVEKAKAKSGHCIILNPETGEILAMAVVPLFNPNIFWKYRPHQWRNRAVTDCYEPGSTIKAFLLGAALETNTVSPKTRFYCENGKFQLGNHIIHDTKEYGELTVSDIIALSSNIGAVKIGQRLGYKRFCDYLIKFGFGEKTSAAFIGERSGFVRPVENAKDIDQATIYFGQGMTSTSLQLAFAMAAIANGGRLMRPMVVKAVTDQHGRKIRENHPLMLRRVLSTETAERAARILEGVVGEKGTGPLAAINGFRVAGKTGTSQKVDPRTKRYSKSNYVAIFVGFVPVESPKLVLLVMIDEPRGRRYGGLVAAPVFREVGAWALHHLRINPHIRMVRSVGVTRKHDGNPSNLNLEPEVDIEDVGLLPDFRGQSMREVLREVRGLGLKAVLEGTGLAIEQTPRPGSLLKKTTTVKVSFRPPM
jgi:cell division protein FtsI (penicillin-binding protein 3)